MKFSLPALAAALLLTGCMALVPPRITDLQWTGLGLREAPPVEGMLDQSVPRLILVVLVRTRWNLAALWRDREMSAVASKRFCSTDFPSTAQLTGSFDQDENFLPLDIGPPADAPAPRPNQHHYAVEILAHSYLTIDRLEGGRGAGPPYDLRQGEEDLCLQIVGGSILGASYRSNTIRIPAAAIRAALDAAGR